MKSRFRFVWIAVALVAVPLSARAQSADDVKEAEAHFAIGQAAAAKHDDVKAIGEFEEAYRGNPDPRFLFSLGEAHRRAKNPERALFYYKMYASAQPDAPNRAEVDGDIAALEQEIAAKKAAAAAPPPPPPPPLAPAVTASVAATLTVTAPPPQPKKSRGWIAGVVIGAVVVAGGAVALGVYFGTQANNPNTFPGASF